MCYKYAQKEQKPERGQILFHDTVSSGYSYGGVTVPIDLTSNSKHCKLLIQLLRATLVILFFSSSVPLTLFLNASVCVC